MKFYTRQQDQGQIVEVSYGYDCSGNAYRRTIDRSDGSVTWERGELDWDREPEGVDTEHVPCVVEWKPCKEPSFDD